tara:strand:+ start:1221 stop:1370 length:150 start_codon:yes stop_codon:yes gene_type:complete
MKGIIYIDMCGYRGYTYVDDIVDGVVASLDNKKELKCEYIIWGIKMQLH